MSDQTDGQTPRPTPEHHSHRRPVSTAQRLASLMWIVFLVAVAALILVGVPELASRHKDAAPSPPTSPNDPAIWVAPIIAGLFLMTINALSGLDFNGRNPRTWRVTKRIPGVWRGGGPVFFWCITALGVYFLALGVYLAFA